MFLFIRVRKQVSHVTMGFVSSVVLRRQVSCVTMEFISGVVLGFIFGVSLVIAFS